MRRVSITTILVGLTLAGAAWASGEPHLWGSGSAPTVPDPTTPAYYVAQDATGAVVAHAYKAAQVFMQLDGAEDYQLVANGRIFAYDQAQRSFVFSSTHAVLQHTDDHGRSVTDCANGKLVAGGDQDARWVADVTFAASCGPLHGRQFVLGNQDGTVTIDPIR